MSEWGPWDPPKPDDEGIEEEKPSASTEADDDYGWGDYPEWPVFGSSPSSDAPLFGEPRPLTPEQMEQAQNPELLQPARRSHDPLGRLFPGLSRNTRVTLDWILTIAGAIFIVLMVKHWVVNPYRIPSSSMEPYLNCAKPGQGCLGNSSDRVLACRICLDFSSPSRGDVVVFNTPKQAAIDCGEGGTFVKRIIGLPGETVKESDKGFIYIRGPNSTKWVKLNEPYISAQARELDTTYRHEHWLVPPGHYFMMGDNRSESCDSRQWGSVPRHDLIGTVFFVYWPPDRIGFK